MRELSMLPTRWKLALAALTTACACNAVSLWRASHPHGAATLVSPWVAPGDELHLDLVFEREPGASSKGEVEERVIYQVSPDAAIGSDVDIDFELNGPVNGPYARAYQLDNSEPSHTLTLRARVLTPLERTARRVASGFAGIVGLALALLASARVLEPRVRLASESPRLVRFGTWAVAAPCMFFFVSKGAIEPLSAAFVIGGTEALYLVSAVIAIAMLFLGKWLCGPIRSTERKGSFEIKARDPAGGYRTLESALSEPTLSELAAAISRGGARASVEGRAVVCRAAALSRELDSRVTIRPADGASYGVRFNDSELLAAVLAALVPARGEIELVVDLGGQRLEYAIKDAVSAAAFVGGFRAAQRAGVTQATTG